MTVSTTWDARLGRLPFSGCRVGVVTSPDAYAKAFRRFAIASDGVFLIAPETGGILERQAREVEALGKWHLGSSSRAIAICADKFRLGEVLQSHAIPTLETHPFDAARLGEGFPGWRFPIVIKPRDGAGSQSMYRVESADEFDRLRSVLVADPLLRQALWQPYVAGHAVSVAVIFSDSGLPRDVFPVAEQRLSRDGRFSYLGGQIPAPGDFHTAIREVALRACRCVPGLRGYVGIDLIVPVGQDGQSGLPVVVEINPRLTTSYLGYRALTTSNLAARMVAKDCSAGELLWQTGPVTFDASGCTG